MKRFTKICFCITAIIIISILFCLTYGFAEEAVIESKQGIITEYKKEASDDFLWNTLCKYLDNEKIVAGIMGFFQRESKMRSDAVAGWGSRDYEGYDSSQEFTQKVDEGLTDGSSRDYFINQVSTHLGGYGLGQWLSAHYLESFYDFAQEWGGSIGDAEMQCIFMIWSIEHQTPKLWQQIQDETDVWIIGRKIGRLYDGTGELGAETIASYAVEYYKKYGTD